MPQFGPYDAILLHDGIFEPPAEVLTHAGGEAMRQRAIAQWGKPRLSMDVNCFALKGPEGVILVDAGTGPAWGEALGHARSALHALGVAPGDVGHILLTHIHGDHALGLFDGEAPYFPQAQILVPDTELAFFTDAAARAATPPARQGGFDIAQALLRAYGPRLRRVVEGPVLPGIAAMALPGHTPGHTGYLVGDGLLLWGDVMHMAALQAPDPDTGMAYDLDAPTAARSRRTALALAAERGWTVSGGHVPGFGRVEAMGAGYRIAAV